MSTRALALRGLAKRFDGKVAVAGVDLDVPAGSFYGLLGPNGAGKTTTLSMAVGLLRPDAGSAWVLGHDVWADPVEAKQLLGVLPDGVRLFDRLTGAELLAYHGLLRGMDPAVVDQRAARAARRARPSADAGRTLVVDYSAGMKKKIGLACALLHGPRLLVLDEPFEAVDPVSAALIRDILQRYVGRRRHGDLLQPRDGGRRAALHPRGDPRRRARSSGSARSTRCAATARWRRSSSRWSAAAPPPARSWRGCDRRARGRPVTPRRATRARPVRPATSSG